MKRIKSHLSYQHLLKTHSQQDCKTTKPFRTSVLCLQNTEETPDLIRQRMNQSTNHLPAPQHLHPEEKMDA